MWWRTRPNLATASSVAEVRQHVEHADAPHGYASSSSDPSRAEHSSPGAINVILFGETGVGKSSIVNLIAQRGVVGASSSTNGCPMQSTRYDIPFDDMNVTIFDTIGLEDPQMEVNCYLKAVETTYNLVTNLKAAGGIHLLLFCMRGGRIKATPRNNYLMFHECLCDKKVPVALVLTDLEGEVETEDWWTRNKADLEGHGIKGSGHACIVSDHDANSEGYAQSQKIRELIKRHASNTAVSLSEPNSWFARTAQRMKRFIKKRADPGKGKLMKVLTGRCKLAQNIATNILEMMEKEAEDDAERSQIENETRAVHAVNPAPKDDDPTNDQVTGQSSLFAGGERVEGGENRSDKITWTTPETGIPGDAPNDDDVVNHPSKVQFPPSASEEATRAQSTGSQDRSDEVTGPGPKETAVVRNDSNLSSHLASDWTLLSTKEEAPRARCEGDQSRVNQVVKHALEGDRLSNRTAKDQLPLPASGDVARSMDEDSRTEPNRALGSTLKEMSISADAAKGGNPSNYQSLVSLSISSVAGQGRNEGDDQGGSKLEVESALHGVQVPASGVTEQGRNGKGRPKSVAVEVPPQTSGLGDSTRFAVFCLICLFIFFLVCVRATERFQFVL